MECIEIALAADGGYFCGLLVTAYSIAKHTRSELRFNILDGGIADADWEYLQKSIAKVNENCSFNRIVITGEEFKDCLLWHGNHMTYARLLLPKLLPEVDYCIYCDVDFLWMRDIAELWNEREESVALISTVDGNSDTLSEDGSWLQANGFQFDPKNYFCAGLTFFNLKYFREHELSRKCFEVLKLKPPFNDQTALYVATYGHQKLVEKRKWQVFTYELTQDDIQRGCVVHHAGEIPWKPLRGWLAVMSDAIMLWLRQYADIYRIPVWECICRFHSLREIAFHRGLFWLLRTPVLRQAIRTVLCVSGKAGAWDMFEARSRRLSNDKA